MQRKNTLNLVKLLSLSIALSFSGTLTVYAAENEASSLQEDTSEELPINEENFPDEAFRSYIAENADQDKLGTLSPEELEQEMVERLQNARIPSLVVTMGSRGAIFADIEGNCGFCPPNTVRVRDTTGAGDAFCAGVAIGLTYGKNMLESCEIGARLASSVITISENTCPRFLPQELGLDVEVEK